MVLQTAKNGSTDCTELFLQTAQNCFSRPHKNGSTDRTGLFLQTEKDCFYRPHKNGSTDRNVLVLQAAQNCFYRPHRTVSTDHTRLFLQTAQNRTVCISAAFVCSFLSAPQLVSLNVLQYRRNVSWMPKKCTCAANVVRIQYNKITTTGWRVGQFVDSHYEKC